MPTDCLGVLPYVAQNVASLDQLFYIGKLVRCKMVSITKKGAKQVVSLTINPKYVNKDVKLVKSGMVSRILLYIVFL